MCVARVRERIGASYRLSLKIDICSRLQMIIYSTENETKMKPWTIEDPFLSSWSFLSRLLANKILEDLALRVPSDLIMKYVSNYPACAASRRLAITVN